MRKLLLLAVAGLAVSWGWQSITINGVPNQALVPYVDQLRFTICVAAGCGSETTINAETTNTSGNFTECVANLSVAPTGSSVIWQVQRAQSPWTSWTAINTITLSVANGLAPVHQATFAASPQPFAVDDKYRVQVTQNDSGGTAQGGWVGCR